MKNILVSAMLILFFCINANAQKRNTRHYNMQLAEVEMSRGEIGSFSNEKTRHGISYSVYKDNNLNAEMTIHPTHVVLSMTNMADVTIKIVWDEAVYVGFNNNSEAVMHSGIKFIDKNETQIPSTIIKGTSLKDEIIIPKSAITWSNKGWIICSRLIPVRGNMDGRQIKIVIPIEIGDSKVEYTFTFVAQMEMVNKVRTRGISVRGGLRYYEIRR